MENIVLTEQVFLFTNLAYAIRIFFGDYIFRGIDIHASLNFLTKHPTKTDVYNNTTVKLLESKAAKKP